MPTFSLPGIGDIPRASIEPGDFKFPETRGGGPLCPGLLVADWRARRLLAACIALGDLRVISDLFLSRPALNGSAMLRSRRFGGGGCVAGAVLLSSAVSSRLRFEGGFNSFGMMDHGGKDTIEISMSSIG
jgi:hypothetical protein